VPVYVPPTQIIAAPPRKATNPALAVAILAGIGIVIAAVFLVTRDDGKKSGGPNVLAGADVPGVQTPKPGTTTLPRPTPEATQGPVIAPGYKMTAIFVQPPNATGPITIDKRIYDALVAGVAWDDAAKLYGRRYPLQFILNNATTNLLLQRNNKDEAKKQLAAAGFSSGGPKFLLTANPGDRVFVAWLADQLRGIGFNVVTDANNFTADEKAKGYYGLIVDVIPA
jgi:hypothetical protein